MYNFIYRLCLTNYVKLSVEIDIKCPFKGLYVCESNIVEVEIQSVSFHSLIAAKTLIIELLMSGNTEIFPVCILCLYRIRSIHYYYFISLFVLTL